MTERCRKDDAYGWLDDSGHCLLTGELCQTKSGKRGWVTSDGRCEDREAGQ